MKIGHYRKCKYNASINILTDANFFLTALQCEAFCSNGIRLTDTG